MKNSTHQKWGWSIIILFLFFFNFLTAQEYEDCVIIDYDPNDFIVTEAEKAAASDLLPVVFNVAFGKSTIPMAIIQNQY